MKKKNILIIAFIFVAIFSVIIIKPISDLDEIWNYNTARAISEGLIPYKDVSMITTPLVPMVTAILLKLIANEVIISRILAAILWTGILFTIYKILEKLMKEENISLICTALIGILFRDIYCIDYNVTVLLIALITLYRELKETNIYDKKNDFITGILAGLAICSKQSIGVTLAVIVVIYKMLFIQNKEDVKSYIKSTITRIIGILIPVIILFIYLIETNAINDFINYAVLGISTFSNKISYITLFASEKIEIKILAILVPITIILMAIALIISKIIKSENNKIDKILTLLIYSLSIIIVMYPISDEIHFLIGSTISIIGLIYMAYILGKYVYDKINYKNKKRIYKIISLIIWIILFIIIFTKALNNLYSYTKTEKNKTINHYKNIQIDDYLAERIEKIDSYIKYQNSNGNNVYILDAEAAIYMIPENKYNKNYDMFLKGNIGKDGEKGQIEIIKQRKENELYLIRKPNLKLNWQTPTEVIKYIRENLNKIGEISIYEIYN